MDTIKGFFKKLIELFTMTDDEPMVPTYSTGALENAPDVRDIELSSIQNPISDKPASHITDISHIDVSDQGSLGTCVAQVFALYATYLDYKETSKVTYFSKRFLYALTRAFSGFREEDGQGLYPRDAAKVLTNVGIIPDDGTNPNMSHSEYVNYKPTAEQLTVANTYRTKGYAFVDRTKEALIDAIYQNGLVGASLPYNPSSWIKTFLAKVFRILGRHYITIYAYNTIGNDTIFYFRNSWSKFWGSQGNGSFMWEDFKDTIKDMIVFTDMPNDVLKRAKDSRFIFLRDLKIGDKGDDVRRLQEWFLKLGLLDDKVDGHFGARLKDAVMQYQRLKNIPNTGNVGPLTRASLNKDNMLDQKQKSKLDLWCEAVEKMEGGLPSRNNPGNIKAGSFTKSMGATGESKGFAVFPTYAMGYAALRKLLTNAATGKSKYYKPDMTILEFFSVYAPASDNNDPVNYASFVAKKIGVPIETQIKTLV